MGVSICFAISQCFDTCAALLAVSAECSTARGLIDERLYDELQYAFDCRLVNVISTKVEGSKNTATVPIYELIAEKVCLHACYVFHSCHTAVACHGLYVLDLKGARIVRHAEGTAVVHGQQTNSLSLRMSCIDFLTGPF